VQESPSGMQEQQDPEVQEPGSWFATGQLCVEQNATQAGAATGGLPVPIIPPPLEGRLTMLNGPN
jgi:hypothetical protein